MHPHPLRLVVLLMLSAAALVGCSDDVDVDAGAVKTAFAERADQAYADQDKSRAEDFDQGVVVPDCFALDDEARSAITDALDVDEDPDTAPSFLSGRPDEREVLGCPLKIEDEDGALGVSVGTGEQTVDDLVEARADIDPPLPPRVDGDAEKLDEDLVVGFGDDDSTVVVYVDDGLSIAFSGSTEVIDREEAFDTLHVVVEEVTRVLADS